MKTFRETLVITEESYNQYCIPMLRRLNTMRNSNLLSLKSDRLVIGKTTYTVNNMKTLPADIHPNKRCTVSNDKVLVSGGLLSEVISVFTVSVIYDMILLIIQLWSMHISILVLNISTIKQWQLKF